jgi:hypothetical protein
MEWAPEGTPPPRGHCFVNEKRADNQAPGYALMRWVGSHGPCVSSGTTWPSRLSVPVEK